ncbi:MAG: hypothetical protein EU539_05975 [Promethearchaeota archaeon]|nr:MAG: hypothetical protein EU539_05975 [Candidatus Lokiarchaeota archaeon]
MPKKEKLDEEDLRFAKNLFGNSKNDNNFFLEQDLSDENNKKNLDKQNMSQQTVQIFNDVNPAILKILNDIVAKESLLTHALDLQSIVNELNNKSKRKIKKKILLKQIHDAIPYIKINHLLLRELLKHFKILNESIKALTKDPIKVKILE